MMGLVETNKERKESTLSNNCVIPSLKKIMLQKQNEKKKNKDPPPPPLPPIPQTNKQTKKETKETQTC